MKNMIHKKYVAWLLGKNTGISSKAIWGVMTGLPMPNYGLNVPFDVGDFSRCYNLLKMFPEWRPRLKEVSDFYPTWSKLVESWDELEALYEGTIDFQAMKIINSEELNLLYSKIKEAIQYGC